MQVRMHSARSSYSAYGYTPSLPPRGSESRLPLSGLASSPPRKVVTDFAAFGAPKNSSVYGTAVQSTPFSLAGNQAAFGSMRTNNRAPIDDDDDEEEESDGRQKVLLREDPISLEQVLYFLRSFRDMTTYIRTGPSNYHAERMAWYPRLMSYLCWVLSPCFHHPIVRLLFSLLALIVR